MLVEVIDFVFLFGFVKFGVIVMVVDEDIDEEKIW